MFLTRLIGDKIALPYLVLVIATQLQFTEISCSFFRKAHKNQAPNSQQNDNSGAQFLADLKMRDTCETVCIVRSMIRKNLLLFKSSKQYFI